MFLGASAKMAVATTASRILGYIRTALFAHLLGIGAVADAFFLAFKIPNLFRQLFAEGAMSGAFIPVFSEWKTDSPKSSVLFFQRVFTQFFIILSIFCALCIWQSTAILKFFYLFSPNQSDVYLALPLLRIMFPYLLFISLTAIFQGVLNTHQRFVLPALTPLLFNVSVIAFAGYVFFSSRFSSRTSRNTGLGRFNRRYPSISFFASCGPAFWLCLEDANKR